MKKCRHCGTGNEDAAESCTECGLDLGPSVVARLAAALPSAVRATNTTWPKRLLWLVSVPILLVALYLLSLGPILRFYGAKPSNVWSRVPAVVRMIYEPLDRAPIPQPLAGLLLRYNQWWMGVEQDKRAFRKLMAQIDKSITNGMPQSQVFALLGEPLASFTNAGTIEAHWFYMPEAILYGYMTNGFVITFTNGEVLRKAAITSGR